MYPPVDFRNCPNFGGGGSKNLRFIRIFDVTYIRTIWRFTKEDLEVQKKSSHLSQLQLTQATSQLLKRIPNTKGTLWIF